VAEERHQVSTSGAAAAQWSGDGRELVLYGDTNVGGWSSVYSADVQMTPAFKAGVPRLLFTHRYGNEGIVATRDLKRFLAAVPVEWASPPSITVILNWQEALKR
jgi:hypothetical protein